MDHERVYIISEINLHNLLVHMVVSEGDVGKSPIIYNVLKGTERKGTIGKGDVIIMKTHIIIDMSLKTVLIEYNHRGPKASKIAFIIRKIVSRELKKFSQLELDFTIMASKSFLGELQELEQIKKARVNLIRPNYDWGDCVNELTEMAADSHAHSVGIEMSSRKGSSLERNKGIIGFLYDIIEKNIPSLRHAVVVGRKKNDDIDTKVSLKEHAINSTMNIIVTDDGNIDSHDLYQKMRTFLRDLRGHIRK